MTEMEKVTACCYILIDVAAEANSEMTTFNFKGVTHEGKKLGDYKIEITKLK